MPTLKSGLVIAGAYADKVRRVLFAQLKDNIKKGEVDSKEVARAAGELNRLLFEILVYKLGIDKGDVVRITVDYDVVDGSIKWNLDTLKLEVWKRLPQEEIDKAVSSIAEKAEEIVGKAIEFSVEELGETDTGDIVYALKHRDREVGAIIVTPLDGEALIRGAVVEPTPLIMKRKRVEYEGDLREFIEKNITELMSDAENTERREAERVIRELKALIEATRTPEAEEEVE
ncbi:MAG: DUF2258 domain-containing protein [Desulfurococcales archaeon]|nr:DUF2258 domain-containing protein [Desulfurococcales archaeon]